MQAVGVAQYGRLPSIVGRGADLGVAPACMSPNATTVSLPCLTTAGADNGSLWFWDWTSGNSFQQQDTIVQPGSLDSEVLMWDGLWLWCGIILDASQQPGWTADRCSRLNIHGAAAPLHVQAGIYAMSFDVTGSRLVTCEADKSIKMWRPDENATPDSHPIVFKPPKDIKRF